MSRLLFQYDKILSELEDVGDIQAMDSDESV